MILLYSSYIDRRNLRVQFYLDRERLNLKLSFRYFLATIPLAKIYHIAIYIYIS